MVPKSIFVVALLATASSVDFFAMNPHSQVPLNDAWYDRRFANCKRYNLRRVY